jgi:hypothetical protein
MTVVDEVQAMLKEEAGNLAVLYKENAEVAKTFWEWRHKLMTRFFTGSAGIVIGASWMFERPVLKPWLWLLFVDGAIFCTLSWWLDRVNMKILINCYKVGRNIEEKLSPTKGIYKCIDENYGNVQYHRTLVLMYLGSAVALAVLAIVAGRYLK